MTDAFWGLAGVDWALLGGGMAANLAASEEYYLRAQGR